MGRMIMSEYTKKETLSRRLKLKDVRSNAARAFVGGSF
jgi:hypothetical protein